MMHSPTFFPQLLVTALLLAGALALAPLAERIGLPGPGAFLAAGIAIGLLGIAPFDDVRDLPLQEIGAVALYIFLSDPLASRRSTTCATFPSRRSAPSRST